MGKEFNSSKLRKKIIEMAYSGSTVHIACAFSIVELLAVLYRNHLRLNIVNAQDLSRDYMVLSKGHGVMAQYVCLHELGWLDDKDLIEYFNDGSRLKGLADAHIPGVEVTSGSLGHGLSVGVGLALAAKLKKKDQMCYALVGDGELNEGTIWEAALFSSQFKLDNLVVIIDENGFQAMGSTDEIIGLGNISEKFAAFGFDVLSVDGHNEIQIDDAYSICKIEKNNRPKAIIAKTIKGKGVSFMENQNCWHYSRLSPDLYEKAINELELYL